MSEDKSETLENIEYNLRSIAGSLEQIEEDVTETYQQLNMFIEQKRYSDVAMTWLENHGRFNINDKINLF